MEISIHRYEEKDLAAMIAIWNEVVDDGRAFPQLEGLDSATALDFFGSQSFCGVARETAGNQVVGLYILHPNNIGRCAHICNASYAVANNCRGRGIGEKLVRHSLAMARELGFGVMQFNAVTASNERAHKLYQKIGFSRVGQVPEGFLRKDGTLEDITLYCYPLKNL